MKRILMSMALVLTATGALLSQSLDEPHAHEPLDGTTIAELLTKPVETDCGAPVALEPEAPATPPVVRVEHYKLPAQFDSDARASEGRSNCIIVCKS